MLIKLFPKILPVALLGLSSIVFAGNGPDKEGEVKSVVEKEEVSTTETTEESTESQATTKKKFAGLRYSGYTRLWTFIRHMENLPSAYAPPLNEGLTLPTNISFGDGYEEPLMLLRLEANPSVKTWFQMEWLFTEGLLRGLSIYGNEAKGARNYRIFQFTAGTHTSIGTFKLTAGGGVNWFKLSPFTMWNFQYRDDMFERYPWEPEGNDFSRYESFYSVGDIPRDQRWGNRGTQGFILEASGLPGGFNAAFLYGKNENSGGFQSFLTKTPQNMISGRIDKNISGHKIGLNFFDQYGYQSNDIATTDVNVDGDIYSIDTNRTSQRIMSVDGRLMFNKVQFFAEFGLASYLSNNYYHEDVVRSSASADETTFYKRSYKPLAFIEAQFDKSLTKIPLKLQLYSIDAQAVNATSTIQNTSIEQVRQGPDQPQQSNTAFYDGMVTQVGQLTNNRQGINLFSNNSIGKFKIEFATSIAQEIDNLHEDPRNVNRGITPNNNSITFPHLLNRLARSRFVFYERFNGPYGRVHNQFRRTFENLAITDDPASVDYKKSFNTIELGLKHKFQVFSKPLIVSFFTSYSSVQDKISAIPLFSDEAFLRYRYHELLTFYQVHPKVTIVGFLGMERAQGNDRTELADSNGDLIVDGSDYAVPDPTGKPIDQTGYGYGIGIDYNFSKRASLHTRNRWYEHSDANFTRDEFKGHEMTIEMKIFF